MNSTPEPAADAAAHTAADASDATGNTAPERPTERRTSVVGNLVRGGLIGVVETVPGVSGGTVALVVGIYTQLIRSASYFVSAMRRAVTGPERRIQAREQLRQVEWKLIIPVFIGMLAAVFIVAGPMADLVDTYPELTRAAFFGMVLASTAIPLRMAGIKGIRWHHVVSGLAAGAFAFWLVSMPPTTLEPSPVIIVVAAAVAVSALLLPGLSGSFLLLTFGLYEPTLRAVSDRDLGYLGLFVLGLAIGVVSIVKGLEWLLANRARITLVVLTGVMIGAMRTLWPWQTEERDLLAPGGDWPLALTLAVTGFAVVAVLAVVDARLTRRHIQGADRRA